MQNSERGGTTTICFLGNLYNNFSLFHTQTHIYTYIHIHSLTLFLSLSLSHILSSSHFFLYLLVSLLIRTSFRIAFINNSWHACVHNSVLCTCRYNNLKMRASRRERCMFNVYTCCVYVYVRVYMNVYVVANSSIHPRSWQVTKVHTLTSPRKNRKGSSDGWDDVCGRSRHTRNNIITYFREKSNARVHVRRE